MYFFLRLKDGTTVLKLDISGKDEDIADRGKVIQLLRNLHDDKYNITEDIKEDAILELMSKIKRK